ncbi:MAG: hypothetical protein ACTSPD_14590 [Promethearchaeota archaeon]
MIKEKIIEWQKDGFDEHEILRWINHGFDLENAKRFRIGLFDFRIIHPFFLVIT